MRAVNADRRYQQIHSMIMQANSNAFPRESPEVCLLAISPRCCGRSRYYCLGGPLTAKTRVLAGRRSPVKSDAVRQKRR